MNSLQQLAVAVVRGNQKNVESADLQIFKRLGIRAVAINVNALIAVTNGKIPKKINKTTKR